MHYLIVFDLVAAIGLYAWSKLRDELKKLAEQEKETSRSNANKKQKGAETLKKDPKTGVYRIDED